MALYDARPVLQLKDTCERCITYGLMLLEERYSVVIITLLIAFYCPRGLSCEYGKQVKQNITDAYLRCQAEIAR